MLRWGLMACVALTFVSPAPAQGLRDKINELFVFGSGQDPLFLAGTADPNNSTAIQAHGAHFVPSAVESNGSLITFLTGALGSNVSNIPISATGSGTTFRFDAGVPVPTSTSAGPIFAERGQTLGRGRVYVNVSVTGFDFQSLRGVDLDAINLKFTHVNVDFPGCDSTFGGDCSQHGLPLLENDFIELDLALDMQVRSIAFVLTYGLLDWIDVGVAMPIITTSIRGTSVAQVVPFGGPTAAHFFAGTVDNPELQATRFIEGSATGIGDIVTRAKFGVSDSPRTKFAILADARFPTGRDEDFLGSGNFSFRGLGVLSSQFGDFSPHLNMGYLYQSGDIANDAVLATIGFDQLLAPWATLAVDLLSELEVGESNLVIPADVHLENPFRRTISPSSIPNGRDDRINGSIGFKFLTGVGPIIVTNAMVPISGGLRPDIVFTASLEYTF